MPKVTIVILTFNSSSFIPNLLKSIKDFAPESEILVVDNASSDDTLNQLKKFGNSVKIIETGSNLGFSKGINYGAKNAKGEYLLFINPDALVKNGKLTDMISVFEENEKIGILGGKMIGQDGVSEKSAGRFFGLIQIFLLVLGLDEIFGVRFSPEKLSKVDFVSGGFMMVRSNLFKKLNGFDENFFMYIEDMDICYRAKNAGFDTYFTPVVSISHAGQGSSNRTFAIINIYKGILYFCKQNKPFWEYQIIRFLLFCKAFGVFILGKIMNNKYYINTYGEALKLF